MSVMIQVKLFTRDGGFVRDGEIPPFTPPPEVITWGSRVFVHARQYLDAHKQLLPAASAMARAQVIAYVERIAYPLDVEDARRA